LGQDPTALQAARQQAFIYLRDNLLRITSGAPSTLMPVTAPGARDATHCGGPASSPFSTDVTACVLPSPLSNYTVSICAPGDVSQSDSQCSAPNQDTQHSNTVSVLVSEQVANNFASVLGAATSVAAAYSEAQYTGTGNTQLNLGLFSYGCITTGNELEIVAGDVYVDTCTIQPQSAGSSAFCAESNNLQSGNIVFGPKSNVPTPPPLVNQSLATCTAASGGIIVAMGQVVQRSQPLAPPAFLPPPGFTDFTTKLTAFKNGTTSLGAAAANNTCRNGTKDSAGAARNNCYSPGVYTTVGVSSTYGPIANNLNPGVYYVVGDPAVAPTIPPDGSGSYSPGVFFGDNTMNANYNMVADQCWKAPNIPALNTFTAPCPDGFIQDPTSTSFTDPQCRGSGQAALATPTFAVAPLAVGGFLDPAGTGSKYFVRVTAVDAFGETASNEVAATVISLTHTGAINVTITPVIGATSYNVYVSPAAHPTTDTAGNDEQNYANLATPAGQVLDVGSGSGYPRFDTSSCNTGFLNKPTQADGSTDNGVTFVLDGTASICTNASCSASGGSQPLVLLSPFCASTRYATLPAPTNLPGVSPPVVGSTCPYMNTGPFLNDGAFQMYSPSTTGRIEAAGISTRWGMSGTLYAPQGYLDITSNALFQVICGQGIFRLVNIQTGNHLNPSFYNGCANTTLARPLPTLQVVR
jgi:hypothetical protein